MSRRLRWAAVVLLASVEVGCGGAATPGAQSAAPAESVDDLSSELEAAEQKLYQELGAPSSVALGRKTLEEGGASAAPDEEQAPDAEAAPERPMSQPSAGGDQRKPNDCATACKALDSMKRSADRICEIAGAAHERCEWANARVAEATKRVEQAGCACSEP